MNYYYIKYIYYNYCDFNVARRKVDFSLFLDSYFRQLSLEGNAYSDLFGLAWI
jgi:hypothetical protein